MFTKTARQLARVKSRRTIDGWRKSYPELASKIGGRVHINDERYLEYITGGTNLLDWGQAKTYAASIVGEAYLLNDDTSCLRELKTLIPASAWYYRCDLEHVGYYTTPCIDWRDVARIAGKHVDEARQWYVARGEEYANKFGGVAGRLYGWPPRERAAP